MTADAGAPLDDESVAILEKEFRRVDRWLGRMGQPHVLPVSGSALADDDQATNPRRLSHLALTALAAAVDHFHASGTLISAGRIVHTHAQFTLLRAALENAATTVYLLAPDDRRTRIFRALRVTWSDMVDQHGLIEKLGQQPTVPRETRKTHLQNVAKAQGVPQDEVAKIAGRPLSYSSIVETAGSEAFGKLGSTMLIVWMLNSGATHGKQWEAVYKIDRRQLLATTEADVHQGPVNAPTTQLRFSAAAAGQMIEKAWSLYDLRRVP